MSHLRSTHRVWLGVFVVLMITTCFSCQMTWEYRYLTPNTVSFCCFSDETSIWTHVKWTSVEPMSSDNLWKRRKLYGAGSQMFIKTVMVWSIACYYHSQAFPPRFLLFFFFSLFFFLFFFFGPQKKKLRSNAGWEDLLQWVNHSLHGEKAMR